MSTDQDTIPEYEPEVTTGREHEPGADPMVSHPVHYNAHPAGIECIDVIEEMTLNTGTAIKHLWRHGLKPGTDAVQDIRKAITYLEFEISRLLRHTSDSAASLTTDSE